MTVGLVIVVAALVYLQFREWKEFNWSVFLTYTRTLAWGHLLIATTLIYLAYVVRALRWRIFLQSTCQTSVRRLLPPTLIGFTGLALLGRPGELLRPYLISRREGLPFSSQLAVWTVKRLFDTGSFTIIIGLGILFAADAPGLPYVTRYRQVGLLITMAVAVLSVFMFLLRRNAERATAVVRGAVARIAPRLADKISQRMHSFGEGLNTISGPGSFASLIALSLLMWLMIAAAFWQVIRAYPEPLRNLSTSHVLLLLGFGIVGSLVQLPMVGGGSQLATIAAMVHVFKVPNELALSCGMMLWLVTFFAVTPVGLWLAHRERISFHVVARSMEKTGMSASA